MDEPLIWWRALHFGATMMVAGVVFFLVYVAAPAFAGAAKDSGLVALVRRRLGSLAWISLAVVVVSGVGWLIRLVQQISDGTLSAVLLDGIVWIVLTKTSFGSAWLARYAFVVLLGGFLPLSSVKWIEPRPSGAMLSAGLLVGSLAFAGHAAGGTGIASLVHLAADIVHLLAAAAWVGALLPLAMLLHAALRSADQAALIIARAATRGFSALGVWSVGALVVTGIVNTWVLAGSIEALFDTAYGRLLLVKIALFLVMVAIAAVNRLVLTPRLVQELDAAAAQEALRRLRRNCVIEAAVGAIILVIVAVLGTLPPGLHEEGLHDEVAAFAFVAL